MILAALQNVDKFYGGQTVLEGATLELRTGARTALIGRNGAGKSTILRLISGEEEPDGGSVFVRDGVQFGILEQGLVANPLETIAQTCEEAFRELDALEERLAELEKAGLDDPRTFERWETLHEQFERRGGYERRSRRDGVLHALGFAGRLNEPVANLSGGERTRLGLARLLMRAPDVLLLDEPTNHLDMEMRDWLAGYLARYNGAALIVSHDRDFLDTACSVTAEISLGVLRVLEGNPSRFKQQRAEQERIEAATRANERKELERLQASAEQMKKWAGQNAKLHRRAKAMEKRVDRFEEVMLDDAGPEERTTRFSFDSDPSGDIVLQARNLSKSFDKPLFSGVETTVRQGERIALLGPNGAGKTTFLRVLLGEEPSDDPRGEVQFGSRVRVGYYDQQLAGVDPEKTLIEEMIRLVGDVEAHNLLGRFLFPFEAQYKQIKDLSGGERARLALLKLTLGRYNLLVLDEPTNHLDVEMIEALEDALNAFEGTLILISHDRRFVANTTDTIWEIRDGHFEAYEGDLSFYQRKRQQLQAPAVNGKAHRGGAQNARVEEEPRQKGPSRWKLERMLEEQEARVHELEGWLGELDARLSAPEGLSPEELIELGREHEAAESQLLEAMAAWEETQEALALKSS